MDAATVVKLALIVLELTCSGLIVAFMCHALKFNPFRAMARGAEVLAFMVVALLPAPRTPGRHTGRVIHVRTVTA